MKKRDPGVGVGQYKTAESVMKALSQIKARLSSIVIFHSDWEKDFYNQLLDSYFDVFGITRSLPHKGCSYDNFVSAATFKTIKTEFVKMRYSPIRSYCQLFKFNIFIY